MKNAIIFGILLSISCISYSQNVTNVKAEVSGNMVFITYDLKGADANETFFVEVFCSGDNYTKPLSFVTGDVRAGIRAGTSKRISWDYGKENLPTLDNIDFKIIASQEEKPQVDIEEPDQPEKTPSINIVFKNDNRITNQFKLKLQSGTTIKGTLLEISDAEYKFRTPDGNIFVYKSDDIERIWANTEVDKKINPLLLSIYPMEVL